MFKEEIHALKHKTESSQNIFSCEGSLRNVPLLALVISVSAVLGDAQSSQIGRLRWERHPKESTPRTTTTPSCRSSLRSCEEHCCHPPQVDHQSSPCGKFYFPLAEGNIKLPVDYDLRSWFCSYCCWPLEDFIFQMKCQKALFFYPLLFRVHMVMLGTLWSFKTFVCQFSNFLYFSHLIFSLENRISLG